MITSHSLAVIKSRSYLSTAVLGTDSLSGPVDNDRSKVKERKGGGGGEGEFSRP